MLKVETTALDGVLLIHPPTQFEDFRGDYVETYNEALYREAGIKDRFVQDDYSTSSRHVLRGFHGDMNIAKLVSCPLGRLYFVVVNNDPQAPHYRRWAAFTLSDANRLQVYIPPKHANAFLVMSEKAIFHYKQSGYYDRAAQFEIKWNDPAYGFWWPVETPITSLRDAAPRPD
ncbi:MAG: dTDP-4-dehydrorhamnose 3,5-epimerase family protein [Hyphomonadaceae bacterium]